MEICLKEMCVGYTGTTLEFKQICPGVWGLAVCG